MGSEQTSHFYLAKIKDLDAFNRFFEEHYDEEDEDKPISEFYGSQGKYFCDHDFMEIGHRTNEVSLAQFFQPFSYAEHWSAALCSEAEHLGLQDANALVFIDKNEISTPKSVTEKGFELFYIGEYTYPI